MNKYQSLKVIGYNDMDLVKNEYEKRISDYGTYRIGIEINPIQEGLRKTESVELFVVNNTELDILQEVIQDNGTIINNILSKIPDVGKKQYFINLLIDEIFSTNEIEGVRSTRKEIDDAISSVLKNTGKDERFLGIVRSYESIYFDEFKPINDVVEIRDIYDEMLSQEIDEEDKLDGKWFRKGPAFIHGNANKVLHRGDPSEESIIKNLNLFINLINSKDYPYLIKIMIAHYLFEYIHPFYNGNGRVGRYITCRYLSEKLDRLTAISFSHMLHNSINKYYEVFTETSHFKNLGEGTMFVFQMLKIVSEGQKKLISDLSEKLETLEKGKALLNKLDLEQNEYSVLLLLIQSWLFRKDIDDRELAEAKMYLCI